MRSVTESIERTPHPHQDVSDCRGNNETQNAGYQHAVKLFCLAVCQARHGPIVSISHKCVSKKGLSAVTARTPRGRVDSSVALNAAVLEKGVADLRQRIRCVRSKSERSYQRSIHHGLACNQHALGGDHFNARRTGKALGLIAQPLGR